MTEVKRTVPNVSAETLAEEFGVSTDSAGLMLAASRRTWRHGLRYKGYRHSDGIASVTYDGNGSHTLEIR